MQAAFQRVTILGLGLMGGSLGLALRRRGVAREVIGWARRPETASAALAAGAVTGTAGTPEEAVRGAELVVVGTPISFIAPLVKACAAAVADGAVVTDVGSTKGEIMRGLAGCWPDGRATFVGSHPMAGSERSGLEAARAGLYEGAMVAVTPPAAANPEAVERVCRLWWNVGGSVRVMDPDTHDRLVARTSHLPHLAAAALFEAVLGANPDAESVSFCGSGFRDTTRVAAGSAEMWRDVVFTNRAAVLAALDRFTQALGAVREQIAAGDEPGVQAFLARVCEVRRALSK